jgi:hypothetical protein
MVILTCLANLYSAKMLSVVRKHSATYKDIPLALQSKWCQYLTGNEILSRWARVCKTAKESSAHPTTWRETVVFNFEYISNADTKMYDQAANYKRLFACKTLWIRNSASDRQGFLHLFVTRFFRSIDHLHLTYCYIRKATIPPTVTTMTMGKGSFIKDESLIDKSTPTIPQVTTLIVADGTDPDINLHNFPNTNHLDIQLPDASSVYSSYEEEPTYADNYGHPGDRIIKLAPKLSKITASGWGTASGKPKYPRMIYILSRIWDDIQRINDERKKDNKPAIEFKMDCTYMML